MAQSSPSTKLVDRNSKPTSLSSSPTTTSSIDTETVTQRFPTMSRDGGSTRIEAKFNPVNSNITAGRDIHLINMAVNKESSILTRLKASLNPVPSASYDSYEAKQRSECFPNTRVQVLNDIETWITVGGHQAPIYVLDGVAGIGKSTIAQTIASRAANLGLLGASFFFSRDEDVRRVAKYLFPTISYQLSRYDEDFAAYISRLLDEDPDAPEKRLRQQFSLLLLKPLTDVLSRRARSTLIVMDALDECEKDSAEELLSLLGQYARQMSGLKILITARPEWHLRQVLDQDQNHEIFRLHDIEKAVVESDIQLYMHSRLSSEEIRRVFPNRRTPWQPSAYDMKMLCGICGSLFIIAATVTKFILQPQSIPQNQLSHLLKGVSPSEFTGSKHTKVLDETYIQIILATQSDLDEIDEDWLKDLNRILGALVVLANPLPCEALALLLEMDPDNLESVFSNLHSLVAPTGRGSDLIFRLHHKSFPDFITNKERIRRVLKSCKLTTWPDLENLLWIDVESHNLELAKDCFAVMNRKLRRNMAEISEADWYKDKSDIRHVKPSLIPPELAYASMNWASHLLYSPQIDLELQNSLDVWVSGNILYWIEVMVILDHVDRAYGILQTATRAINNTTAAAWMQKVKVEGLLSDASRFIQQGIELMKISPMHIYRSCLPFLPTGTVLHHMYNPEAKLHVAIERSAQWEPLLLSCVGHSSYVTAVAFSNDGSQMVSGSADETIRFWDTKTGAHIQTFTGHSGGVHSIAFSRDGSQIVSGSSDGTIRLWDSKTGEHVLTLIGHQYRIGVRSVSFSYDGSRLASGSDAGTIFVWNAQTGAHIFSLTGHSDYIKEVAFSKDDSRLASACNDQTLRMWNTETGECIFTMIGHSAKVNSVAFSHDGLRLASASEDNSIRIWNAETGAHISTLLGHSQWVYSVAFSNDGSLLASGSRDQTIRLWDAKTGAHVSSLLGHSNLVLSVAFSSDSSRLVSGSLDDTLRLWDIDACTSPSFLSTPPRHLKTVTSVAFATDGSLVASGSYDDTVCLWNAKTGANLFAHTGRSYNVHSVAFSADGSRLACCSSDNTIQLWDVKTGMHISTNTGHSGVVTSITFSNDGSQMASGSYDHTARIWNAKTDEQIHVLQVTGDTRPICFVAFSSDSLQLVSVSDNGIVQLWDARTGVCIQTHTSDHQAALSIALSNDDAQLQVSVTGVKRIWLWDVRTGKLRSILNEQVRVAELLSAAFLTRVGEESIKPTSLLLLVKRESPMVTGLIKATLRSEDEWEIDPLCWFPPGMEARHFAFNHSSSRGVIGFRNGRIMIIDFSSELHQAS